MASRSAPSTPAPAGGRLVPSDAPTGTWTHPRFDEINQRQNATTFGDRNIRSIWWNIGLFVLACFLPSLATLTSLHPVLEELAKSTTPYDYYTLMVLRTLPLLGIAYACAPLMRSKDDLADIPLTPSQRALLGLEPSSRPATPGSSYITPPRYARSPTPRSSSGSAGSPFSGKDTLGVSRMGAPPASYSPTASPLLHKAIGRESTRRLSLGTPSPSLMGKSIIDSSNALVLNTPTPASRGASVGLNSRWLYEKSRASVGQRGVYS